MREGVMVRQGAKVLEVDPRGDPALCFGLGERPRRVAEAVRGVLLEGGWGAPASTRRAREQSRHEAQEQQHPQ